MASDADFKEGVEDRSFLRCSCYLVAHDTIYDLLFNSGVAKPMHSRGIRIESYIDKESYEVQSRVTGL